jgi:hypothetical protein
MRIYTVLVVLTLSLAMISCSESDSPTTPAPGEDVGNDSDSLDASSDGGDSLPDVVSDTDTMGSETDLWTEDTAGEDSSATSDTAVDSQGDAEDTVQVDVTDAEPTDIEDGSTSDAEMPDTSAPDAGPDTADPDISDPDAVEMDAAGPDATDPDIEDGTSPGPPDLPWTVNEDWLSIFGGDGPDEVKAVAADSQGNVYLAGIFRETSITIGTDTFASLDQDSNTTDAFVASFDAQGDFRWAHVFGAEDSDTPYGLAIDSQDRLVVAGSFMADLTIGGALLVNQGSEDIFVVVYEADGTQVWAKGFGGPTGEVARAVAVDAQGDIFLTGGYNGTITVDEFVVGTVDDWGLTEIFVFAVDASSGEAQWLSTFEGNGHDLGTGITVTPQGEATVALSYQNDLTIVEGQIAFDTLSSLNFNAALLRLDDAGAVVWVNDIAGKGSEEIRGVDLHEDGRIFVTGLYTDGVGMGGIPLESSGVYDVMVASYAADGTHLWSNGFGGESICQALGLDVHGDGVYVTGRFKEDLNLGVELLSSPGEYDSFITVFNVADGGPAWAKSVGGAGGEQANGVAVAGDGGIYVVGHSEGGVSFAGETVPSAGAKIDGFVLRLAP